MRDEAAALGQLKTEWAQSVGAEKRSCMVTTQIGGFASYVELLTCLEMARDSNSSGDIPLGPQATDRMQPAGSGVTVGEGH